MLKSSPTQSFLGQSRSSQQVGILDLESQLGSNSSKVREEQQEKVAFNRAKRAKDVTCQGRVAQTLAQIWAVKARSEGGRV